MEVHPALFVSSLSTDAWRADPKIGGGAEEHVLLDREHVRAGLTRFTANADPGPLLWDKDELSTSVQRQLDSLDRAGS